MEYEWTRRHLYNHCKGRNLLYLVLSGDTNWKTKIWLVSKLHLFIDRCFQQNQSIQWSNWSIWQSVCLIYLSQSSLSFLVLWLVWLSLILENSGHNLLKYFFCPIPFFTFWDCICRYVRPFDIIPHVLGLLFSFLSVPLLFFLFVFQFG